MKKVSLMLLVIFSLSISSCDILKNIDISKFPELPGTSQALSTTDIIAGLKEALNVGTKNAVNILSKENGFFGDPLFKIPFPSEVKVVEDKLRQVGLGKMIDDFVKNMNHGAEQAVSLAVPIFVDAIKQMSFDDAKNILKGPDNAATEYFQNKTTSNLFNVFKPKVNETLDKVQVTKHWNDIFTAYNKIPLVKKVETDLAKYVTNKALDGLFNKLANEEKLIRTDPGARVTDILKKVFGS